MGSVHGFCAWVLCMGSVQGAVHIVAVRLGCKGAMVGTSRGNAHPGYMNGLALTL